MDVYPDNKTSDFTVHLPKELDLSGPWEVALVELFYPNSWYNIDGLNNHWIYYRQEAVSAVTDVPIGYYQQPKHVVEQLLRDLKHDFRIALNEALNNPASLVTEPVKFRLDLRYNVYSQVASLEIDHKGNDPPNFRVTLSDSLAQVLGFSETIYKKPGVYHGSRIVALDTVHVIYVYCDLVEPRIVGDTLAPLLSVVPAKGRSGEYVSLRYEKPQYHPVLRNNISDVRISLRDDQGNRIRFRKGKSIVGLHFRRHKLEHI